MNSRSRCVWRFRRHCLELGGRTWIAGILNLTPDSFFDGGTHPDVESALQHARRLLSEGADLLDLGGESSRPGANSVPSDEEQRRILPVLRALRAETDAPISIDTRRAETAAAALECGADIINDITALRDPDMAGVVSRHRAGLVLMHMRGDPATMQQQPVYEDVLREVETFLCERIRIAREAGIEDEALAVDPGIGFGKTPEQNRALLRAFSGMRLGNRPWWIGVSRKSWLGTMTGRPVEDRLAAGLGALAYAALNGAHVLRVHDVKDSCDTARVVDHLLEEPKINELA